MRFDVSTLMALLAIGAIPSVAQIIREPSDSLVARGGTSGAAVLEGNLPAVARRDPKEGGSTPWTSRPASPRPPSGPKGSRPRSIAARDPRKGGSTPWTSRPASPRPPSGPKGSRPRSLAARDPRKGGSTPWTSRPANPKPPSGPKGSRPRSLARRGPKPPPVKIPESKGFSGHGTPKAPGKAKPETKRPAPLQIPKSGGSGSSGTPGAPRAKKQQ